MGKTRSQKARLAYFLFHFGRTKFYQPPACNCWKLTKNIFEKIYTPLYSSSSHWMLRTMVWWEYSEKHEIKIKILLIWKRMWRPFLGLFLCENHPEKETKIHFHNVVLVTLMHGKIPLVSANSMNSCALPLELKLNSFMSVEKISQYLEMWCGMNHMSGTYISMRNHPSAITVTT